MLWRRLVLPGSVGVCVLPQGHGKRRQALLDDLSDAELERLCNLLTPLSQPPTQEQLDALSPDDRAFLLAMEDRFSEAIE